MNNYDYYNREERAICAHLFRLLHEQLENGTESPFGQFLNILSTSNLTFKNGNTSLTNLSFENVSFFCEAAIIRDAYHNKKPNVNPFLDDLTRLIMQQERVNDCRLYSELPETLNNIQLTHPKQIRMKAASMNIRLSEAESKVYGAMQGIFNAKPDLVLTVDNVLLVCEAKFTEAFDSQQLERTRNITEIWSTLLFKDLGFSSPPINSVFKLGASVFKPDVTWTEVLNITERTYQENDRTRIAIKSGVELLKRKMFEI